ncbi:MAG: hypothetical protein ROO73_00595 [Roseivirga sp.]
MPSRRALGATRGIDYKVPIAPAPMKTLCIVSCSIPDDIDHLLRKAALHQASAGCITDKS